MGYTDELGKNAKATSRSLVELGTTEKSQILGRAVDALLIEIDCILAENARDIDRIQKDGISPVMVDRLHLDAEHIEGIVEDVRQIADLQNPVGQVVRGYTNLSGLRVVQKYVPLSVIAMIFKNRPSISVDAFSLALKTGSAIVLHGGRDAICSNAALVAVTQKTLAKAGISENAAQLVGDTSHAAAEELMQVVDCVDVLVPRGGARLIQMVKEKSEVPVIETDIRNVHIYVNSSANFDMTVRIVIDTRTQRSSICNAAESSLVHEAVVRTFLPQLEEAIAKVHAVEFHAGDRALAIFKNAVAATDEDYGTEFSDCVMPIKVVDSTDDAVSWVNRYTTHHSGAIITKNLEHAGRFQDEVDAAAVYINASARFIDDFVLGLGAGIGISAQRMHTHGLMDLEALTSTKSYINGKG